MGKPKPATNPDAIDPRLLELAISVIREEHAKGPLARRIAKRLAEAGITERQFSAATSDHHGNSNRKAYVAGPLQNAIANELRDAEKGFVAKNHGDVAYVL